MLPKRTRILKANPELVKVLLILYVVYVVGDMVTTRWLVMNDPLGIAHEGNPLGRFLYLNHGFLGLTMLKLAIFIALTLVVLITEARYRHISWFRELTETTLLGMLSYSTITLMNNSYAIIMINRQVGSTDIEALYPLFKVIALICSILLNAMILRIRGIGGTLRYIELILGTIVVAGPLLFYRLLLDFLRERLWLGFLYTLSVTIIVLTSLYMFEEIKKRRIQPV